jgi:hypothetical protein
MDTENTTEQQPDLLQITQQTLRELLAVAESEAVGAGALPADLVQAIAGCAKLAAHHATMRTAVNEQLAKLGDDSDDEERIIQLAIHWGKAQTVQSGAGNSFAGKVFGGDIPVQVYIAEYKKFVGLTDSPKQKPAQQQHSSKTKAAALAVAGNDNSSSTPAAEPTAAAVVQMQTAIPTPRIEATKRAGIAQELARIHDCAVGEALVRTRAFLDFVAKTISAESLRKNSKKSTTPNLNAVGVYLGVLDSDTLVEPTLLPAEVSSITKLCALIFDTVREYRAELNALILEDERAIAAAAQKTAAGGSSTL